MKNKKSVHIPALILIIIAFLFTAGGRIGGIVMPYFFQTLPSSTISNSLQFLFITIPTYILLAIYILRFHKANSQIIFTIFFVFKFIININSIVKSLLIYIRQNQLFTPNFYAWCATAILSLIANILILSYLINHFQKKRLVQTAFVIFIILNIYSLTILLMDIVYSLTNPTESHTWITYHRWFTLLTYIGSMLFNISWFLSVPRATNE